MFVMPLPGKDSAPQPFISNYGPGLQYNNEGYALKEGSFPKTFNAWKSECSPFVYRHDLRALSPVTAPVTGPPSALTVRLTAEMAGCAGEHTGHHYQKYLKLKPSFRTVGEASRNS